MEVARGTAVARRPLESRPARALARVAVTGSVHYAGAGALTGCREEVVTEGLGSWDPRGDGDGDGDGLTLAARAVEARCAELTVRALEAGFAHAAPHPWVLPAGVALGPGGAAVTVCGGVGGEESQRPRGPQPPTLPPQKKPPFSTKLLSLHLTLHSCKTKKTKNPNKGKLMFWENSGMW